MPDPPTPSTPEAVITIPPAWRLKVIRAIGDEDQTVYVIVPQSAVVQIQGPRSA